jgi:hypothetical protein
MKDLSEIGNDKDLSIPILERILEITPDDNSTRFSLAYKYSDRNNDLSLFHYLRIPEHERKSMAWNNLGVVFRQLDLPAKSVEAYRKAEEMGGTLAMSNIAC